MNSFVSGLVEKMRDAGIETLLVKGQGIAQTYERPGWRTSGDVDFFLDAVNYEKAKSFLLPMSLSSHREGIASKHQGMKIESWEVELHGTLHCGLSSAIDNEIDLIQEDVFTNRKFQVWHCGETDVYLPEVDADVVFIFTHFLNHFYKGGIGLRQICDWCRLLWSNAGMIDVDLLARHLETMRLIKEWKAFAALAIDYLGFPAHAMPLYDNSAIWSRKASRIKSFIQEVGNFGHNRDLSYYRKYPYLVRKAISLKIRLSDLARHAVIFPQNSFRFLKGILFSGLRSAARGE